ncbi:MAG TPA: glycosyltransferase family 4 protein [Chthonomonas sp.]|jgi:glycosyltransferase involved in cell wall biosynthesis|uniref:glycosyltransferase family 4 protein n=1 Tax=Chthonomonas sp. TaxID=2282153 RepID=UPI002B4AB561|nr:glycosyltransferase family 4 protein [Chthonomonas sp.]HLH79922.1 glycosyltransferase family 4 protein [Chthonomonas sp.]
MRVAIAVAGTFHAFRLAEQLNRRRYLVRLLATHRPLRGERIDGRLIVVNSLPEILMRVPRRMGLLWAIGDYLKAVSFDRWAASRLPACDILVTWAGHSLRTLRTARRMGIRTVLERGSVHVRTQWRILEKEYKQWGCVVPPGDRRLLDLQLREYEEADYICVPSKFALRSFIQEGLSENRLICIPYGVDVDFFSPGESRALPFRVLTVGLGLRKGTPYLLDAAARLNTTNIEIWLVGAPPLDVIPFLRKLPGNVKFLGPVSHLKLPEIYRQVSVFVLPSLEEGLSLSVLEALACGVPVVVTPNTGAGDIIVDGRKGRIVPPQDSEALRRVIMELYEDAPKRHAMARAAAETARAWSWDNYGDRVVEAYRAILRHRT